MSRFEPPDENFSSSIMEFIFDLIKLALLVAAIATLVVVIK